MYCFKLRAKRRIFVFDVWYNWRGEERCIELVDKRRPELTINCGTEIKINWIKKKQKK